MTWTRYINGAIHGKWNLIEKIPCVGNGKECNVTLINIQNIISIIKEEKDSRMVIKDNLSPEKRMNKIFGDTLRMPRNILMTYHFLDKDMMRKL